MSNKFKVTITERLKLTVEADGREQAEQIVADDWRKSRYILDADNFASVDFEAVPSENI